MSSNIPELPASLKSIQHYLKTAVEHDNRDPVVAYWCRLHALQTGLKVTNKTPEETKALGALMDWLEQSKKQHKDNDAITIEVAAQAHLENYALKLFLYADKQDREQNYGKNVVKAFYTAGMIYDVLTTFGDLTEEATQNRKYAKWKAAYIHNCLKNGETPVPGPMPTEGEDIPAESTTNVPSFPQPTPPPQNEPQAPSFPSPSFPSAGYPSTGFPSAGFSANQDTPTPPAVPSNFSNSLPDPNVAMRAASQLPPVPYTPDPNPGGFVPYDPSQQPTDQTNFGDQSNTSVQLNPDQISKAQKYCKWASSALNYDDVKTAVMNLRNALTLLQTGRDPA